MHQLQLEPTRETHATIGGVTYYATVGPSIANVLQIEDAFNAIDESDFEAYHYKKQLGNEDGVSPQQMLWCLKLIRR